MADIIHTTYSNGHLKLPEDVQFEEGQRIKVILVPETDEERLIIDLEGEWAEFAPEDPDALSFEEIEKITHDEHMKSMERLFRQLDEESDDRNESNDK